MAQAEAGGRWPLAGHCKGLARREKRDCLLRAHKNGPYSDMQKAEKMMAEAKGIRVLTFEFI